MNRILIAYIAIQAVALVTAPLWFVPATLWVRDLVVQALTVARG